MEVLVGYTGFVGSNLSNQRFFDLKVNSKNISEAFDSHPDNLIYSGVSSEMFIANNDSLADYDHILNAIGNIQKIKPKHITLISTTSVYDCLGKNEDHQISEANLSAYGKNRLYLERWVENNCRNHTIIRLPAIFGNNLRKNFIFDFMYGVPSYLKHHIFQDFSKKSIIIKNSYYAFTSEYYRIKDNVDFITLKTEFNRLGFNSISFTDSRSTYQYYPLKRLSEDIDYALNNSISKINLVTPPVNVSYLYHYLTGGEFENYLEKIVENNVMTKWSDTGYVMSLAEELYEIKKYIEGEMR